MAKRMAIVSVLNRKTSDGEILQFMKDGSSVGSIGVFASRLYVGNDDTFLTFEGAADKIYPATSTGAGRDNAIDLGGSTTRFKDLYLSGTVTAAGTTINGNVAISNSSGDTLTLTKSTTEPSLRIEGDSGKDNVITVGDCLPSHRMMALQIF